MSPPFIALMAVIAPTEDVVTSLYHLISLTGFLISLTDHDYTGSMEQISIISLSQSNPHVINKGKGGRDVLKGLNFTTQKM